MKRPQSKKILPTGQPAKMAGQPVQPVVSLFGISPAVQARQAPLPAPKAKVGFDQWYAQACRKNKKLTPNLKKALMLHMEARGFMKSGDYDKGLKDFGL